MSFVQELLNHPSVPAVERKHALDRVYAGPGIPDAESTTASFWLKQQHPKIHQIQSSNLPAETDVLVIGSGITGTSVVRNILTDKNAQTSNKRVLMLEAREICSGATGRNGGHCLETAEEYLALKEQWGKSSAQKITRFKIKHLEALVNTAKDYGIFDEAQVRKVKFLSAHFDVASWEVAKMSILALKQDLPEETLEWDIIEDPTEIQKSSTPKAAGIIAGPAGALWPYKFVTSILSELSQKHHERFSIESNTPVLQVVKKGNKYEVTTPRGIVNANHVVHCTNGYAAHLLPQLLGRIYPVRGQMSAQRPLHNMPNYSHDHSWLFNYGAGFDYLTQLPTVEGLCKGEMMLGGGFVSSAYGGIREIGTSRDDKLDSCAAEHLEGALENAFDKIERRTDRVKRMWTGIMGFSADGLPWVGEVPETWLSEEGSTSSGRQWVAAGFSGEGMVNTWLSGQALGTMILASEEDRRDEARKELADWFPEEMFITEDRIESAKLTANIDDTDGSLSTDSESMSSSISSLVR